MKLSDYIKKVLAESTSDKIEFDIPLVLSAGEICVPDDINGIGVTRPSEFLSRIKFTVVRPTPKLDSVTSNDQTYYVTTPNLGIWETNVSSS